MIADDHEMFIENLVFRLKSEHIETIGTALNGKALLQLLEDEKRKPDVILLDLEMPIMDGKQTLIEIKKRYPFIKVIIVSSFSDGGLINDFIANGASSYVCKMSGTKALIEAIRSTKTIFNYSNIVRKQKSFFTEMELIIIPFILRGKTNKEIAILIGKAERTIEGHRERLYEKTGSKNSAEFGKYCAQKGLYLLGENFVT